MGENPIDHMAWSHRHIQAPYRPSHGRPHDITALSETSGDTYTSPRSTDLPSGYPSRVLHLARPSSGLAWVASPDGYGSSDEWWEKDKVPSQTSRLYSAGKAWTIRSGTSSASSIAGIDPRVRTLSSEDSLEGDLTVEVNATSAESESAIKSNKMTRPFGVQRRNMGGGRAASCACCGLCRCIGNARSWIGSAFSSCARTAGGAKMIIADATGYVAQSGYSSVCDWTGRQTSNVLKVLEGSAMIGYIGGRMAVEAAGSAAGSAISSVRGWGDRQSSKLLRFSQSIGNSCSSAISDFQSCHRGPKRWCNDVGSGFSAIGGGFRKGLQIARGRAGRNDTSLEDASDDEKEGARSESSVSQPAPSGPSSRRSGKVSRIFHRRGKRSGYGPLSSQEETSLLH